VTTILTQRPRAQQRAESALHRQDPPAEEMDAEEEDAAGVVETEVEVQAEETTETETTQQNLLPETQMA
jgi:hypothetical protein